MSIKGTTYWVPVGLTPTIQDCLPFGDADFAESPEFIRLWRIIKRLSKIPLLCGAVKYYSCALDALYLPDSGIYDRQTRRQQNSGINLPMSM